MDQILMLLKLDLGISNTAKDDYYTKLIDSCITEIERKGIVIDISNAEDAMLVSDYAAWRYRKRQEDVSLPQHILSRIRDRIVKKRSVYNVV